MTPMLGAPDLSFLKDRVVLITGGTGSLGKMLAKVLLSGGQPQKIIIFSRDELKQYEMANQFAPLDKDKRLRFFLGDVRDRERCMMAFSKVDYIIHASALKQVPAAEYNPFEFVRTNILGAQNVIEVSIERGVRKVIALSTDKAANPINLYGATKFCSDKLFISGNRYVGVRDTCFSVVRYGNVVGSRGSVIPFFLERRKSGVLPITHPDMTRFWITLKEAAYFVLNSLRIMEGMELFVPRIPSMKLLDLARLLGPECRHETIGIRPGEKMHEVMVPADLGRETIEFGDFFVIEPSMQQLSEQTARWKGRRCAEGFSFSSDRNDRWMTGADMKAAVLELELPGVAELRREWKMG